MTAAFLQPQVEIVYAAPLVEEPKEEVRLEVVIDWTEERIIEEIHAVFPEVPLMEKVAKCESHFKKTAYNPTNNSHDNGIFQISDKFHRETYTKLGFTDMTDVKQNIAYARILYDESGLQPWEASRHCWSK